MTTSAPIDFVVTWVDGSDPAWQKQKNEHLNPTQEPAEDKTIDAGNDRYRDWDILHYWFRCVEKYAPWVNKIHFVTWGHIPSWLNTEHPKLNIVRHEDYIPEEFLPTFSSHPIELFMHKIPGLAEQFVYFNDDMFLTAPTRPEDFFVNGLPCDSLSETRSICENGDPIWECICQNNSDFLNRHFNRKTVKKQHLEKWYSLKSPKDALKNIIYTFKNRDRFHSLSSHHITQTYLKSTFESVWALEPELLYQTCSHRFRNNQDINHFIFREYQLLTWQFHLYNMYTFGRAYQVDDDFQDAADAILSQRYKVICLNDGKHSDFNATKAIVNNAFETVFPNSSSFEK